MKKTIKFLILIILILIAGGFLIKKYFYLPVALFGSAELSWDAVADENLKGYKIYYGENKRTSDCPPSGYAKNIDAGNNTEYKLNKLENGKTYYFSVVSYNSSGKESCFSPEMSKTIHFSFWDKIKLFWKNFF